MSIPYGIEPMALSSWKNRHGNFEQRLVPGASFTLFNPITGDRMASYNATTANLQWLIRNATAKGHRLRALGAGWSFSKVNAAEHGLVNTKELRLSFNIAENFTHASFRARGGDPRHLLLTQCGMSVEMLNNKLERESTPGRCLRASGAAHGQSIVGAFSTNTHGGAFRFGSVHDQIVGLHLVVAGDRHVWLERASDPIVDQNFVDKLPGAELLRDDDLFNSALVSFGSFGFIHGVMLEGRKLCLLEEHRSKRLLWSDRTRAMLDSLDIEQYPDLIPGPLGTAGFEPYHFEVGFNPHQLVENDPKKCLFVKVMYRKDFATGYPPMATDPRFQYGDNTFEVLQTALDILGRRGQHLIPGIVNLLYPLAYAEGPARIGTMSEHFNSTRVRGRAASLAVGVAAEHTSQVIDMVLALNRHTPFAGVTALRFVKGSPATLAFTRFPKTCVLEMDGVDSKGTNDFYRQLVQQLAATNMPFTLHWGKVNHMLDEALLQRMYPQSAIDTWRHARTQLLSPEAMAVFTNGFMESCGLERAQVIV